VGLTVSVSYTMLAAALPKGGDSREQTLTRMSAALEASIAIHATSEVIH
jgi:hypothetical protein